MYLLFGVGGVDKHPGTDVEFQDRKPDVKVQVQVGSEPILVDHCNAEGSCIKHRIRRIPVRTKPEGGVSKDLKLIVVHLKKEYSGQCSGIHHGEFASKFDTHQ